MLGEVFYWVFNMSIVTSLCGLIVLLLRCIRRIPRRVFVWLWFIPLIRMCLPIGMTAKYSLMSLISKFTTQTVIIYESDVVKDFPAFTMTNCTMGASSYFPIVYKVDLLEDVFSVGALVWGVGAVALFLAFAVIYFVTMKEIKGAVLYKENIYYSDKVRIPAVYGIFRPRIVLPYGYREQEIPYVLMHERAHICRQDNLLRIFAFLLTCLHWFNPFCWLFLKRLLTDIEFACDEAVLSKCDEAQKEQYAHTLLNSVEQTNVFAASFGGAKIRLRIENIVSYRKMSVVSLIGFTALLISIAYILLTNAR